jgi:hypothetical protein
LYIAIIIEMRNPENQLLAATCPSSFTGINSAVRKFSWSAATSAGSRATLLTGLVRVNLAVGKFGLLGTLVGLSVLALAAVLYGFD